MEDEWYVTMCGMSVDNNTLLCRKQRNVDYAAKCTWVIPDRIGKENESRLSDRPIDRILQAEESIFSSFRRKRAFGKRVLRYQHKIISLDAIQTLDDPYFTAIVSRNIHEAGADLELSEKFDGRDQKRRNSVWENFEKIEVESPVILRWAIWRLSSSNKLALPFMQIG